MHAALLSVKNNEKRAWKNLTTGEVFEATRTELRDKYCISLSKSSYLINKPEKHKSANGIALAERKYTNNGVDNTIYELLNVKTGHKVWATRRQMVEDLGLTVGQVGSLMYREGCKAGGFRRSDSAEYKRGTYTRNDPTVYVFLNSSTGEVIKGSRLEIAEKYGLCKTHFYKLIKEQDKTRSSKGFYFLGKEGDI